MKYPITITKQTPSGEFLDEKKIDLVGISESDRKYLWEIMNSNFHKYDFFNGKQIVITIEDETQKQDVKDFLLKNRFLVQNECVKSMVLKSEITYKLVALTYQAKKDLCLMGSVFVFSEKNTIKNTMKLANQNDLKFKDIGLK